jgi:hypothetical protein
VSTFNRKALFSDGDNLAELCPKIPFDRSNFALILIVSDSIEPSDGRKSETERAKFLRSSPDLLFQVNISSDPGEYQTSDADARNTIDFLSPSNLDCGERLNMSRRLVAKC